MLEDTGTYLMGSQKIYNTSLVKRNHAEVMPSEIIISY